MAKPYQRPQGFPQRNKGQVGALQRPLSLKKGRRSPVTLESRSRKEIEDDFPNADWTQLKVRDKRAPRSGGAVIQIRYHTRDKWYDLYTKSAGDTQKTLNQTISKEIKRALFGVYSDDEIDAAIAATNKALLNLHKQEETQQKALQQAETKAAEAQRLRREMEVIRGRTKDVAARIQELEDTQGPLDKDAIQKLKDEKRKLVADHQAKRKQLDALAKAAQQAQKLQQDINKTIISKGETERRLGKLKAQKDAVQPFDELKQKAAELNEHITEDLRIIEDENTSPSERTAARERLAVRNEELEALSEEIGVRERQRTIGQKLGSLLPGLIGSMVSFIFKAAGQVLSFLGEHAWLLILAVVAFFMERLLKKRRT